MFVKNRVLKIRQFLRLEQVKWVPGVVNPVDTDTRGLTVIQLKEARSWTQGLEFLKQLEGMWPEQPQEPGCDLANLLPDTITGQKKTRHGNINEL
jgi:hypothetical protein